MRVRRAERTGGLQIDGIRNPLDVRASRAMPPRRDAASTGGVRGATPVVRQHGLRACDDASEAGM
jgi:hypothetical protein